MRWRIKTYTVRSLLIALAAAFVLTAPVAQAYAAEASRTPNNTMLVKIDGGKSHMTRSLSLPLNKAAIVQLPVDARDALVSNPKIADAVIRTPRRIYVLGLEVGQTNAFFFDSAGQQILNLEIKVERDFTMLDDIYKRLIPDGRIEVDALSDNIVISGFVENPSQADQARDLAARFVGDSNHVISMLSVKSSEQVLLKVRVAEMQRTLMKQLGINLGSNFTIGEFAGSFTSANPFSLLGRPLSSSAFGLNYAKGSNSVDTTLQAMERDGLMRTLAEPNLTAISGESAKFLAGGEFPVPVSLDQNGNVTIVFKPFGVGLGFTPVVLSGGRISLQISTEVSETTSENSFTSASGPNGGITIPGLSVRRAETTVELPSGGSIVMAGLLQDSIRHSIDGVPGLKNLPVLGALFRSSDYQNKESELVVVVTPYLVGATDEQKIALPTDGFAPASDLDTLTLGRTNAVYPRANLFGGQSGLQGPVGFVMK